MGGDGGDYKATMGAREWALLVLLSLLWGGSFFFNGVAVRELPTFTVVVCRVAIAAAFLHLAMRAMGVPFPLHRRACIAFLGMGFLNNVVPFTLIVWGQSHIASAVASILNATTPLFTALVAHWSAQQERLTANRVVGMAIALAGVAAMLGEDLLEDWGADVWAQFAILGASVSYAFAAVFGRRFRSLGVAPMASATGQVTASSLVMIPLMLAFDRPWELPLPGAATVAALLGLALLSTALAYLIYFRILSSSGATNLLLVTFLIPPSATVLGIFVLDEQLFARHFAGMALIGAGLAAFDGRIWRRLRGGRAGGASPADP